MRESQRIKLLKAGIGKAQKSSNRRQYKCIQSGCSEKAIKSHSQQKKCQLESISENLYVYSVDKGLYNIFSDKPREILVKKTITESSRYKGYCNAHDTDIFLKIENNNLDISNNFHNYLLLLRCISYEFANKRDAYLRQVDILNQVGDLFSNKGRMNYEGSGYGLKMFLEIDAPYYFLRLNEIKDTEDYSQVRFNSFEIDKNLGVSCSTCFSPLMEEHGEWMSQNIDSIQPFVSMSIIPSKEKTLVSFCWLAEFDEFCDKIRDIDIKQDNFIHILNMLAFTQSEDTCVTPSLWEQLTQYEKTTIYQQMGTSDSLINATNIPLVMQM
ncbi:hypothetical protein [Aliivibrio fischeri]|uniref:hypothetical protein n=1 Tax=Aliivibrio fischeri TaxID=668 RepID=UPI0007C596BF|nr:hypothetical protein [Aliivibrio fischeri]